MTTKRKLWGTDIALRDLAGSWVDSLESACGWCVNRSMITTVEHGFTDAHYEFLDRYDDWRGAFRGEYHAGSRTWDVFCPVWHGGQGVKGLAMAYGVTGDPAHLDAAKAGADFILRNQVADENDPDLGMIHAYETGSEGNGSAAVLECLEGLFTLGEVIGDSKYQDAAVRALYWEKDKMYLAGEGLFQFDYEPGRGAFRPATPDPDIWPLIGRPLLDDAAYLTGFRLTGDESLKQVALETAERLLADEDPPGNWVNYTPANKLTGDIHPRHGYWWGRPMWMVYKETGDQRFLDCCRRSAQWYVNAMRADGGLFRNTGPNFNTPSFGHATSGIAGAAVLWAELIREFGDEEWKEPLVRALAFCRSVQFTNPEDKNLEGAILEKVLPPDGTDVSPWYLRDLGTFFYLQALSLVLRDLPDLLPE